MIWLSSDLIYIFPTDAPERLKTELDDVLTLQGDIDAVSKAIQTAKTSIKHAHNPLSALRVIETLEQNHGRLQGQVNNLYTSLNIPESFPELERVDLEFVKILLMARDLKIIIRKRAIGSFFEWDKLDRAVGGRHQALGALPYSMN